MRPERPQPFSKWRTSRVLQGEGLPRNSTRTWPRLGATEKPGLHRGAEASGGKALPAPHVLPALKEQHPSPCMRKA